MLNVLLVAYPFAPVGPDATGGAEQILSELERQLVQAGHCATVIACNGSKTRGTFVSCGPQLEWIEPTQQLRVRTRLRQLIEHVIRSQAIDLVHFHGIDFHEYLPRTQRLLLATLHLSTRLYPQRVFSGGPAQLYLNCVSQSQHRSCPGSHGLLPPIENGVCLEHFFPCSKKQDYAVVMGRICPEKGYHLALQAAHAADIPLLVAGRVFPYPEHVEYFEREVVPLLDEKRRFIGPVGQVERARLLAEARCLIVPSLIEETSSLVAMEALASATPVVALARGALPDVIDHGRTGLLVHDVDEMATAIRTIGDIDPQRCRLEAERRFSSAQMFGRYLGLYRHLVGSIADVG